MGEKTKLLVAEINGIKIVRVESELEALLLEAYYIKKYRPHYNIRLTDDKSYPLIKITPKAEYPSVLYARRMDDLKALFFGPFPSPQDVRRVLRVLRKIFPFQSVVNHAKRPCLYYHLGLCPCLPAFDTLENRKTYQANLKKLVAILEGRSRSVQKTLEKERAEYVKSERFEDASRVTEQLAALEFITKPHHVPFEYETNPNLRDDLRQNELSLLQEALNKHGLRVERLKRIECYDISNTQGTNATGSLVVLTAGEIDKSQYRRFKIKKDGSPNDFAMMEEMLTRRIKHPGWAEPDLIIVDGGKGQVTAAQRAFAATGKTYPLIGLAKRLETIILPGANGEFQEVNLDHSSPALQLLQRIRNEAHRFAITYHKNIRSKKALETT